MSYLRTNYRVMGKRVDTVSPSVSQVSGYLYLSVTSGSLCVFVTDATYIAFTKDAVKAAADL